MGAEKVIVSVVVAVVLCSLELWALLLPKGSAKASTGRSLSSRGRMPFAQRKQGIPSLFLSIQGQRLLVSSRSEEVIGYSIGYYLPTIPYSIMMGILLDCLWDLKPAVNPNFKSDSSCYCRLFFRQFSDTHINFGGDLFQTIVLPFFNFPRDLVETRSVRGPSPSHHLPSYAPSTLTWETLPTVPSGFKRQPTDYANLLRSGSWITHLIYGGAQDSPKTFEQ